jgi:predicted nucleic-acid-binding protein
VKALDTNVLIRFLVEDDEAQSRRARKLVEEAGELEEPLFVSDVVVCETVWVLESRYKVSRRQVAQVLDQVLHAAQLAFGSQDLLVRALGAFARGRGDFADYVIAEHARGAGCDTVATFDRSLLGEPGFTEP